MSEIGDYVIVFRAMAGTLIRGVGPPPGSLLASFDPEAVGGCGIADWTEDHAKAMRFITQEAAWECWRQIPRNRPTRSDGKPNRPLTAYTVEIGQLEWLGN